MVRLDGIILNFPKIYLLNLHYFEKKVSECMIHIRYNMSRKVIGAKYFSLNKENQGKDSSPTDEEGHGSHTSSTIAGAAINDASLYGLAKGTVRGGVPSARIAIYKVCWDSGCSDMDILAAFDEAIADGVDIISVSIGGPSMDFLHDPIALGSFHAMKKEILTSCSGGNDGPYSHTIQNVAPWIFTVAASSIDRKFSTSLKLGNGKTISVSSLSLSFSLFLHPPGRPASPCQSLHCVLVSAIFGHFFCQI